MGISQTYKKRIISSAKLVKNTRSMAEEMSLQNKDYAIELQGLISSIKLGNIPETSESSSTTSLEKFEDVADDDSFFEKGPEPKRENKIPDLEEKKENSAEIPAWAKEIWREIMKVCHPDKTVSQNLTIEERFLRVSTLEKTMEAYDEENWDEILYLGVLLDKFTEKLSGKKQMSKLEALYNKSAEKIHEIQNSVSWEWGTSWENLEKRVVILSFFLARENIPIPDKEILIEKILKLDL